MDPIDLGRPFPITDIIKTLSTIAYGLRWEVYSDRNPQNRVNVASHLFTPQNPWVLSISRSYRTQDTRDILDVHFKPIGQHHDYSIRADLSCTYQVTKDEGSFVLFGLEELCRHEPAMYADVSAFMQFFKNTMSANPPVKLQNPQIKEVRTLVSSIVV